ncbi:tRNA (adenosine(37)-N6)-dimethylallyltransferase MiaA [Glaciimonas immobilis]|uniref:tRNA dimethylallyltransferase n=2 Tax=Glaciimonas immobilis TaxID=728004 RepID=A0A840RVE3_9BURK|nr:tRNA (adenosine(37)-N6)-dimethylallyltransferase MiaA [Glaciimonas immobilis]KAF3997653.1 tRNA (adenosine(37)-N6)-dimethylallyltransferase MiaA [Glaciimonas immobilis]MBB5200634.1 tRNA dimethylallyltransferase [Glaciimonas immobilis]
MNQDSKKRPLVIAIMGPTASGKTAAALEIVRHIPSEIISVDSALVYRGMDIGTAKPTAAERDAAPHHLIDIIEPTQSYSAMQFCTDTLALIGQIHARGKLALMVGGTMLYFKALRDGLDTLPQADPALRARLDAEAAIIGVPGMHAKLALLDPITAERLKPNDSQRIQRALEIIELSGQTMSSLLTNPAPPQLPFDVLPIALEPSDRSVLHGRIAQRFDLMLENKNGGLIAEVESLRARGDLHPGLPSMRCVGYRQAWEYLDGQYDFEEMREKGIIATRQLAKRQLTWLRAMPDRIVIDCIGDSVAKKVLNTVIVTRNDRE